MTKSPDAVRITGFFHREISSDVLSAMEKAGLGQYRITAGRCIFLLEKKGLFGLRAEPKLIDHPVDLICLETPQEAEQGILNLIVEAGNLAVPGRGSVFSERIAILNSHPVFGEARLEEQPPGGKTKLHRELTGICCIVGRGEGDIVARIALDTGTCAPAITFGHGTGVRDKLGLLRIAIPAEKEVVLLVASSYDAAAIMNMMIQVGKLNQPGRGFIYLFPIRMGQIDMKVITGMPRHAASMEQIIVALDEIRGDTSWRARGGSPGLEALKRKNYLKNLATLSLSCDAGRGEALVRAAMRAGAPGATITQARQVSLPNSPLGAISPAREICTMLLEQSAVAQVSKALEDAEAFGDEAHGMLCKSDSPLAYTFISG
ncbi:MAG: hypothetical protein QMD09_13820 [Desulfatibacillaceae bacterium]|nr:hypothetical protein [Desulfatibacillaceae bacterium]